MKFIKNKIFKNLKNLWGFELVYKDKEGFKVIYEKHGFATLLDVMEEMDKKFKELEHSV